MSAFEPHICCPNSQCSDPLNPLGSLQCASCDTPLIYRYLWAVGELAKKTPVGTQVAGRYYVLSPYIWLDTQPGLMPEIPTEWSEGVQPYFHLYPYQLHLPEIYGFCLLSAQDSVETLLLENVPLDQKGVLYPAIAHLWSYTSPVRQLYWLWQMLELWQPLQEQGVAASLLAVENVRVEGWRIRLCQLIHDAEILPPAMADAALPALGLADLANVWLGWVEQANPAIAPSLKELCQQMQTQPDWKDVAQSLNRLLLQQTALLPLRIQGYGQTETGPERSHNEDSCYPTQADRADPLATRLAIVCDGIGGHEGGEVASQLAVQSIKPQIQALLAEMSHQPDLLSPEVVTEQLDSVVRVVNNLIATQNNLQAREARRRMGTTLIMAIQLPQPVFTRDGLAENSHELYLVNVGDSRAYWITPRYCHRLTVDDDVSTREVRLGRAIYREALDRPDAGALTQAIGTRDADLIHPTIQRFVIEEDGILLLCSDGLSDNGLVEQFWASLTEPVFKGKTSLESLARDWIGLASEKNGYDNISLVMLLCRVSPPVADVTFPPGTTRQTAETEWSPASQAIAQAGAEDGATAVPTSPPQPGSLGKTLAIALLLLLLSSGLGLLLWSQASPDSFQQFRERILGK